MSATNLQELIEEIFGLEFVGMRLGLEMIFKIMEVLNNPQNAYSTIHVTGTNGKGSVCSILSSILTQAGYRVGFYSSPHLFRFNERIRINDEEISNTDLEEEILCLKEKCNEHNLQPTFFEFTTALAFSYFKKKGVDIAIIEVGIGGDMDSTNVIIPQVSVITNIGYDHQHILGKTLKEIAQKKAGIIKENVPLVCGERREELITYFKEICALKNSTFNDTMIEVRSVSKKIDSQEIEISNFSKEIDSIYTFNLIGEYQIQNVSLALCALYQIKENFPISKESVKRGLQLCKWEGRMQVVSKEPLIIIDGAHNKEGFSYLSAFVSQLNNNDSNDNNSDNTMTKKVLLLGLSTHKEFDIVLDLAKQFNKVIITKGEFKPENPLTICAYLKDNGIDASVEEDIVKACKICKSMLSRGDIMVCAGSLYMIPKVIEYFKD